jgi:hypothetical protein
MENVIRTIDRLDELYKVAQTSRKLIRLNYPGQLQLDFPNRRFLYNNYIFGKRATTQIYDLVGIKSKFSKKLEDMSSDPLEIEKLWSSIQPLFESYIRQKNLQGVVDLDNGIIEQLWENNYMNNPITFDGFFGFLKNYLIYNKKIGYDNTRYYISTVRTTGDYLEFYLIDSADCVDFFEGDEWRYGIKFEIQPSSYSLVPVMVRVICTNGLSEMQEYTKSDIRKSSFGYSYIADAINSFLNRETRFKELVALKSPAFKVEASIREYSEARELLVKLSEKDGVLKSVVAEKLPYSLSDYRNYYKVRGVDFREDEFWLSTAKSGVSAYELLNVMTEVSSSSADYAQVDYGSIHLIQNWASNFFFKEPDLSKVSVNLEVDVTKLK